MSQLISPNTLYLLKAKVELKTDLVKVDQCLVQTWLRKVHGIHIHVYFQDQFLKFKSVVTVMRSNKEIFESSFHSQYEEALEDGIQQALNHI